MTSHVPNEIVLATANGDVATVRCWLENGGDANQELPFGYRYIIDPRDEGLIYGQRLLAVATENDRCDLIRLLVAHGAEVDHAFYYCKQADDLTAIAHATQHPSFPHSCGKAQTRRVIFERGVLEWFYLLCIGVGGRGGASCGKKSIWKSLLLLPLSS